MPEPYYFGTYREPGHYLWRKNQQRVKHTGNGETFRWLECDLPWTHIDGRLNPPRQIEGQAFFYPQSRGYCGFAFANFTDDKRAGSNSVFFIPGDMDFKECLITAQAEFSWVFEHLDFEIVQISQLCTNCSHGYHRHRKFGKMRCNATDCDCQRFMQICKR